MLLPPLYQCYSQKLKEDFQMSTGKVQRKHSESSFIMRKNTLAAVKLHNFAPATCTQAVLFLVSRANAPTQFYYTKLVHTELNVIY